MSGPGQAGHGGADGAGGSGHGGDDDDRDDSYFLLDDDPADVYEWIDEDSDDPDAAGAPRGPRRPLREWLADGVASARAEVRQVRRRAVGAGLAVLLVAGGSVGFTAWYDAVAGAADRADVVALTVDSVVNADPATASLDSSGTSATVSYVVELANNGQDPVDLRDVKADGGTLIGSKAWKAVGSSTIAAGGTAQVELTMRVDCTIAMFGGLLSVGDGNPTMPFPDLDVTVLTRSGDVRSARLSTKQDVNPDRAASDLGALPAVSPRVVMADTGPCQTQLETRNLAESQVEAGLIMPDQSIPGSGPIISLTYEGMAQNADSRGKTFLARFHVVAKDTPGTNVPVTISGPFAQDGITEEAGAYTLTMSPKTVSVPNGGAGDFSVAVHVMDCQATSAGMFPDAGQLQILAVQDDPALGRTPSTVLNQELGSLVGNTVRLALDEIAQDTAACR